MLREIAAVALTFTGGELVGQHLPDPTSIFYAGATTSDAMKLIAARAGSVYRRHVYLNNSGHSRQHLFHTMI